MSRPIDVFDEAASEYDAVGVDFFTPIGAALAAAAGIRPGDRVLDVGCGRGAVLFPAARAAGPDGHVTGIDLAPDMVARTAADAADMPQVDVRIGDAQAPAMPAGSVDVITAGLLLFFLPDPRAALGAYRRILKAGGRLAFSSFARIDPRHRASMQAIARHAIDPPPPVEPGEMFQDADRLRSAVEDAGFSGTRVEEFTVRSEFRDLDHYLRWVGSHGGRGVVTRVPAGRIGAVKAELATTLPEPPELTTRIFLTVASRDRW